MLRDFRRDPTGQTLVEFALVLPVFLLLVIGLMAFALITPQRRAPPQA